jgi:hypothetical protein
LNGHLFNAKRLAKRSRPLCWFRSLQAKGLKPEIFEIEAVPEGESWQEAERFWIAYFRSLGANLVNETPGGDGWPAGQKMSVESSEKKHQAMLTKSSHGFSAKARQAGIDWWKAGNKPDGWCDKVSKGRTGKGLHPGVNFSAGVKREPYGPWAEEKRVKYAAFRDSEAGRVVQRKASRIGVCGHWYVDRKKECICGSHKEIQQ